MAESPIVRGPTGSYQRGPVEFFLQQMVCKMCYQGDTKLDRRNWRSLYKPVYTIFQRELACEYVGPDDVLISGEWVKGHAPYRYGEQLTSIKERTWIDHFTGLTAATKEELTSGTATKAYADKLKKERAIREERQKRRRSVVLEKEELANEVLQLRKELEIERDLSKHLQASIAVLLEKIKKLGGKDD